MTDKQLGRVYTVTIAIWLASMLGLSHYLDKPMSAEQYADKLCQELYGTQAAAYWSGDRMMCITQRGEILPAKRPE
jgi:hypothetical protein